MGGKRYLSNWRRLLGLDQAVVMTLLLRAWSSLAGVVTILLVPRFLTQVEQGFYYAIASLLALQVFFELGLNFVVSQFASHEYALHRRSEKIGQTSAESVPSRVTELYRLIDRWYRTISFVFAGVVGFGGAEFFNRSALTGSIEWMFPWFVAVAATAVNLYWSPSLAILEGCAEVAAVARMRAIQAVIASLVTWGVLVSGLSLWACVSAPCVSALWTGVWVRRHPLIARIRETLSNTSSMRPIDWRREVLPMQWRIALSWISGYFIFQLFVPLAFKYQGAIEAGRLGLCMAAMNAVQSLGMSWCNAKAPTFGMYVAEQRISDLFALVKGVTVRTFVFTLIICMGLFGVTWTMYQYHFQIAERLPEPIVVALVGGTVVVNSIIFCFATYMRAHKEEPMLGNAIITGICVGVALWMTATISIEAMTAAYAAVISLISLPWCVMLLYSYIRRDRAVLNIETREMKCHLKFPKQ